MATVDDVLNEAYRWVGYKEDWDGEHVFSPEGGFGPEAQWCGLYVEHCFRAVGIPPGGDSIPRLYYTPQAASDFQARGQWTWDPQPGDAVLFNWEGMGLGSDIGAIDHIGIVTDTSGWGDGWLGTVEGNITVTDLPQVGTFTRHKSVITGFGRPLWDATQPTSQPDPVIEVAQHIGEDDMLIIRNKNGWYSVIGGKLVPILGGQQFKLLSKENVAQVEVSDAQLQVIKDSLA